MATSFVSGAIILGPDTPTIAANALHIGCYFEPCPRKEFLDTLRKKQALNIRAVNLHIYGGVLLIHHLIFFLPFFLLKKITE